MHIDATIAFVKKTLAEAEGGHDWFHIERVWRNAKHIAKEEGGADMEIVELGALLHDIADAKFHDGDEEIGPKMAREFLETLGLVPATIAHVENIVRHISFKGSREGQVFMSPELAIVQDADRLDAIGAIGIARTFNYGGFKGRPLYDPSIAPNPSMSKEEYKKGDSPTINHFYEKLLLLKEMMNTKTGKKLAAERHAYMETFLAEFFDEWNGLK
jgi:uncharacterized protein